MHEYKLFSKQQDYVKKVAKLVRFSHIMLKIQSGILCIPILVNKNIRKDYYTIKNKLNAMTSEFITKTGGLYSDAFDNVYINLEGAVEFCEFRHAKKFIYIDDEDKENLLIETTINILIHEDTHRVFEKCGVKNKMTDEQEHFIIHKLFDDHIVGAKI
jgi:hypothetical protein|tara:strand:- start:4752 stop:5225 length:474 start_codon:yes stop_codon:yes gene_type:complete